MKESGITSLGVAVSDPVRIDFKGLATLQRAYALAPAMVDEEVGRFVRAATDHITAEAVDRTPSAFGDLRRSISGTVLKQPIGWEGLSGTALGYGPAVELGAKPHFVGGKGIEALTEWVKQKFTLGREVSKKTGRPLKNKSVNDQARGIAWAIAWKIHHRGTKGAFMFKRALTENEQQLQQMFDETVSRVMQRLGGAV